MINCSCEQRQEELKALRLASRTGIPRRALNKVLEKEGQQGYDDRLEEERRRLAWIRKRINLIEERLAQKEMRNDDDDAGEPETTPSPVNVRFV